ncbi:hypothetical protein QBC43DRAFT_341150 [Cladorrhinum sp. PSN259]|nr:hypothetical protein QBC43DRAFT_341150 [Cladorrhinum sp. PSN259]
MASQGLPENWEWDFDGKRWFYRYKPTGLIQYTWPKPGDEFPDFVEDGAPPPDLAPEEMLISQKQRRRSTLDNDPSKPKRKENKQSFIIEEDDGPGEYWDQPDALMYMGPGAYNDISPLQEDDDIRQDDARADEKPSPFTAGASPQKATGFQRVTEQFERTHISPLMSAETTPLVPNSQPVIATPEIDRVPVVEANNYAAIAEVSATPAAPVATAVSVEMPAPVEVPAPVEAPAAPVELPPESSAPRSPDVPLLDSRQVPYTPVGFVAELPSELTAQCHEEINPTPVELPGHEIMMESSTEPVIYANAFPLAPAELHSDAMIPSRVEQRRAVEPKTLAFKTPELDGQRRPGQAGTGTHTFNHETPPIPRPAPLRQNSMPQTGHAHSQSLSAVADSSRGQFKPYNPALGAVTEGSDQNSYAPSAYVSASESHIPGLSVGNKRHSLAATPSSSWKPSDVPAALKPFKAWKPLPPTQEGATAGHEVQDDNMSAPARFPSVLQPARGRPNITQTPPPIQSPPPVQSPPPNQRVDANQRYQAYKPVGSIHQNLQRDIDSTLNEFQHAFGCRRK